MDTYTYIHSDVNDVMGFRANVIGIGIPYLDDNGSNTLTLTIFMDHKLWCYVSIRLN